MLKHIGRRHTYMLPDTGSNLRKAIPHLQVCMTDPGSKDAKPPEAILSFSVGTYVSGRDTACILPSGCHGKIPNDSMIYYGIPHILSAGHILERINSGDFSYCGLLDEKIFENVCRGVRSTKFIKPNCISYLEMRWQQMGLKIE
jgi:hypothetical protein